LRVHNRESYRESKGRRKSVGRSTWSTKDSNGPRGKQTRNSKEESTTSTESGGGKGAGRRGKRREMRQTGEISEFPRGGGGKQRKTETEEEGSRSLEKTDRWRRVGGGERREKRARRRPKQKKKKGRRGKDIDTGPGTRRKTIMERRIKGYPRQSNPSPERGALWKAFTRGHEERAKRDSNISLKKTDGDTGMVLLGDENVKNGTNQWDWPAAEREAKRGWQTYEQGPRTACLKHGSKGHQREREKARCHRTPIWAHHKQSKNQKKTRRGSTTGSHLSRGPVRTRKDIKGTPAFWGEWVREIPTGSGGPPSVSEND